ncbi:MAG TPA: PfkB family carbohydrate kinase [bacterium]|nr:PfkB family carbohydrate kinase [bacterium]
MSLVVVGSVALDSVETPYGKRDEALGGAATYASCAASLFGEVAMVAVVGSDFPKAYHDKLLQRGICLDGLVVLEGPTFRWTGVYQGDMGVVRTLNTQLGVFESFRPIIPDSLKRPRVVLLESIHPELQLEVLDQMERPELVAMDTIRLWINQKPDKVREVIRRSDLVILNDEEVRSITGENRLVRAAETILSWGPRNVIVKRGEHGASLYGEVGPFSVPSFPTPQVKDPTGAGDSFAGAFLGFLLRGGNLRSAQRIRQAMVVGTVVASFNVEELSIDRLERVTLQEIQERCRFIRESTAFDEVALG